MTNWKVFKIKSKQTFPFDSVFEVIKFNLDGDVTYKVLGNKKEIKVNNFCFMKMKPGHSSKSCYDCDSYQIGDYLEINIDETVNRSMSRGLSEELEDLNNIVRKVGSSAVVSSSSSEITRGQAIADRLIREVNSQPPGKVEFEHRIEHRDRSPERFIYRKNH